jgi:hypothetical protein
LATPSALIDEIIAIGRGTTIDESIRLQARADCSDGTKTNGSDMVRLPGECGGPDRSSVRPATVPT